MAHSEAFSGGSGAIDVLGGGLSGSEAAFQLAERGLRVRLHEMRPCRASPAHQTDRLAELVCSNSLRSDDPMSAVGLLHEELRRLGSIVLWAADETRVPAGGALAVDRALFGQRITARIESHPNIDLVRHEVCDLPAPDARGWPTVVCTGPLTSEALARAIAQLLPERLAFYDAIAPIVAADSIDRDIAFEASRYGKGEGADYLNLPLDEGEYARFVEALLAGEKVQPHAFEVPRYFEGCLPIETMAERGRDCLAYGPMKPVGLVDPRTGRRPHAVVQLRAENRERSAFNLVGFQTRLTWPEQRRIFRMLPGLANAEFLRLGQVHRNTFIDAPRALRGDLSLKVRPDLFLAGQITGVEGYVESTASGLLSALSVADRLAGRPFVPPPPQTALGALYGHLLGHALPAQATFQPSNITFALFAELPAGVRKHERKARRVEMARAALSDWMARLGMS